MEKPQVRCAGCGLNNKPTQTNCIRCYASLAGLPVSTIFVEGPSPNGLSLGISIPLWMKLAAGGGVLFVVLLAALAFTVFVSTKTRILNRYAHLENAIRVSPSFNVPPTVDVSRYTYYDENGGQQQEATPAAYTLAHLGLLYVHIGMYSDVSPNYNSQGKIVMDPFTGIGPRAYRHVSLELVGAGQAQSANWEPYEIKKDGKVGWKVPIGERELLRVVEVKTLGEMQGDGTSENLVVSFTWRWKPNEVGRAFDKASPSYFTPDPPKGLMRSPFEVEINDSRATYWGTAELRKTGNTWEAAQLIWLGTSGVKLSPNASAEIDRIIKESQGSR